MMIVKAPQLWIKPILFAGVFAVLTACGGGGGSNPPTPPDTTPNAFTLNVVNGAEPGVDVISESITVGGINAATPVSISGGEYSINSGAYTSAAGTVTNGQRITVKVTSSSELETDVSAVLTIGGVPGTFIVTTLADTTPPTAQITFPPPVSMKDAETLLIRGTASDDYSSIASLTVNGVAAVSEDGFVTWTAEVELAEGENELVVVLTDASNNTNEAAASVRVHRALETNAFPDSENPITYAKHITYDNRNKRILVTNWERIGGISAVIAVDPLTGKRTILSDPDTPNTENAFVHPAGIVIDANAERNRAIVVDEINRVFAVDLTDGARSLLSNNSTSDSDQPVMGRLVNIALDPGDPDIAYIVDRDAPSLQKIDLVTGKRTLVSDNNTPDAGTALVSPRSIMIDAENNRVLVGDGDPSIAALFSVDLETGGRTMISDLSTPQTDWPLIGALSMASDNLAEYVLVDTGTRGIIKVDVSTGEREQFFVPFSTSPSTIHTVHSLYYESGFAYLFYLDNRTQGVYAIDLKSADYVVLSKSQSQ